ncbi:GNAT family N-acetyltransferase [Bacillaceae bacterium IKA-2]|nr:GNAT family N-acetyltransferase [Bacillaceae bacterium IKA-2]
MRDNLDKKIDIRNRKIAEQVLNIQIPAYRVEAEIIDFFEIPPLKDTVASLQQCGETFFGFYLNEEMCGAISIKVEKNVIDIHRLIVNPNYFRKGIAKRLLDSIESMEGIETIKVTTGSKNTPAVNFYEGSGFNRGGEIILNERLSLTSFIKKVNK